ncbi:hypothetical protein HKD37_15G042467 [Glycine soja]
MLGIYEKECDVSFQKRYSIYWEIKVFVLIPSCLLLESQQHLLLSLGWISRRYSSYYFVCIVDGHGSTTFVVAGQGLATFAVTGNSFCGLHLAFADLSSTQSALSSSSIEAVHANSGLGLRVMDKVVEEAEKVKKEWDETYKKTQEHIEAIAEYGKPGRAKEEKNSLARLNGIAQDGLALLSSFLFTLDLLAPQLPSEPERELLLGGGEESTVRRRNLQTKAGMTSAAESITESLRRTRQLMVQEVERNTSTLMTLDESTGVLKKAESEYKGHRSLLMRTRNLLSTMQRQDRKVTEAIKAGMVGQAELRPQAVADDLNLHQVRGDCVHNAEAPLEQRIHDEL